MIFFDITFAKSLAFPFSFHGMKCAYFVNPSTTTKILLYFLSVMMFLESGNLTMKSIVISCHACCEALICCCLP